MDIKEEIQDWQSFGNALREENRLLYEKMMSELEPEILEKASVAKDPTEVILMGLMFQQQKKIESLIELLKSSKPSTESNGGSYPSPG